MRRTFYNAASHSGTQPVRVLKWNLAQAVESFSKNQTSGFIEIRRRHGLQPSIAYDYTEASIVQGNGNCRIPFVDAQKQITIHETFLSLVWTMCYSHLTLFEEQILKPQQNRSLGYDRSTDHTAVQNALEIYNYGVSLVHNYSQWDKDKLPNPEFYDPEVDNYIGRASGLFAHAMGFIVCHEVAHIDLGHLDDYISKFDKPLSEVDADERAVRLVLDGVTDEATSYNYVAGMLLAFCSLLTLTRNLESDTHPNLASRIERVLTAQALEDTSNLWGIATMSFKLWDNLHNPKTPRISWPKDDEANNFRSLFYNVFRQIK